MPCSILPVCKFDVSFCIFKERMLGKERGGSKANWGCERARSWDKDREPERWEVGMNL
jgi:hypothetical protein